MNVRHMCFIGGMCLILFCETCPCIGEDGLLPGKSDVEAALEAVPDDPAADAEGNADDSLEKKPTVPQFTDLGQAVTAAAKQQNGILILFTAEWCPWCKKQLSEFERPSVAEVLQNWTVAVIDVDEHQKTAQKSGVESLPTLQVQTVDGRIIASQNGFLEAEELIPWLNEQYEAIVLSREEFSGDDPPDKKILERLLLQFQSRNPVAREAAIHRLLKHPQQVAASVAKRLQTGPLQTRLTAWELLHEWKAPVDSLDPWRPETLTPDAFTKLNTWVEEIDPAANEDEPLSPEQILELEDDISALLRSDDPAQQRTIRERLARHGRKLLPVIYAQLAKTQNPADRDRLTVLRYRVVSPNDFVLRWPNGLERLVDANVEERHAAIIELTEKVTSAEEGLLLELFSDPDPFVRELCLRALRTVGGSSANMALLRLLEDPSPDVRAAVLGQLAESPSPEVVPQLSAYLEKETDPDLLVHAIRALRAVGNESAVENLMMMFEHSGWHVRAEAVEAVGEILRSENRSSDSQKTDQSEVEAALLSRLGDEDGFVVSRSVQALRNISKASKSKLVEPLADAAIHHPELALEIVQTLSELKSSNHNVTKHLQAFAAHDDPRLRAAALQGMRLNHNDELPAAVLRGLQDQERTVRIAAAKSAFQLLNDDLPRGEDFLATEAVSEEEPSGSGQIIQNHVDFVIVEEPYVWNPWSDFWDLIFGLLWEWNGLGQSAPESIEDSPEYSAMPTEEDANDQTLEESGEPADADRIVRQWRGPVGNDDALRNFYQRSSRPDWETAALPSLQQMLKSEDAEEQLAAAMCLVPLGQVESAWPIFIQEARENPNHFQTLSTILPWLTWDRRRELFDAFMSHPTVGENIEELGGQLVTVKDRRAEDYLWSLMGNGRVTTSEFSQWNRLFLDAYGLDKYASYPPMKPIPRTLAEWKLHGENGTAIQKLMAACLLHQCDSKESGKIAQDIYANSDAEASLRADALQIVWIGEPTQESRHKAVSLLHDAEQPMEIRRVALDRLAGGSDDRILKQTHLWLAQPLDRLDLSFLSVAHAQKKPSAASLWGEPPTEITPQDLQPFLDSSDKNVAAEAAFLSIWIHGDRKSWQQLEKLWQQREEYDISIRRLVYRAIAALNDDSLTPLLAQVYEELRRHDSSEVEKLYWTIHSLKGPAVEKVRQRIDEENSIESTEVEMTPQIEIRGGGFF